MQYVYAAVSLILFFTFWVFINPEIFRDERILGIILLSPILSFVVGAIFYLFKKKNDKPFSCKIILIITALLPPLITSIYAYPLSSLLWKHNINQLSFKDKSSLYEERIKAVGIDLISFSLEKYFAESTDYKEAIIIFHQGESVNASVLLLDEQLLSNPEAPPWQDKVDLSKLLESKLNRNLTIRDINYKKATTISNDGSRDWQKQFLVTLTDGTRYNVTLYINGVNVISGQTKLKIHILLNKNT